MEWCNRSEVIKYLFKYVTKGTYRAKVVFTRFGKRVGADCFVDADTSTPAVPLDSDSGRKFKKRRVEGEFSVSFERDEIEDYLDCRYQCDEEAVWRMFGYEIHRHSTSVERLTCHWLNMNTLLLRPMLT